jgi:hypothetical protein
MRAALGDQGFQFGDVAGLGVAGAAQQGVDLVAATGLGGGLGLGQQAGGYRALRLEGSQFLQQAQVVTGNLAQLVGQLLGGNLLLAKGFQELLDRLLGKGVRAGTLVQLGGQGGGHARSDGGLDVWGVRPGAEIGVDDRLAASNSALASSLARSSSLTLWCL